MRAPKNLLFALTVLLALVAGCDRSPYDVMLRVTDQDDHPIPRAAVILEGLEDLQMADEAGTVTWTDLEDETLIFIVGAQGYVDRTVEVTLERGHNEVVVALEQAVPTYDPTNP